MTEFPYVEPPEWCLLTQALYWLKHPTEPIWDIKKYDGNAVDRKDELIRLTHYEHEMKILFAALMEEHIEADGRDSVPDDIRQDFDEFMKDAPEEEDRWVKWMLSNTAAGSAPPGEIDPTRVFNHLGGIWQWSEVRLRTADLFRAFPDAASESAQGRAMLNQLDLGAEKQVAGGGGSTDVDPDKPEPEATAANTSERVVQSETEVSASRSHIAMRFKPWMEERGADRGFNPKNKDVFFAAALKEFPGLGRRMFDRVRTAMADRFNRDDWRARGRRADDSN